MKFVTIKGLVGGIMLMSMSLFFASEYIDAYVADAFTAPTPPITPRRKIYACGKELSRCKKKVVLNKMLAGRDLRAARAAQITDEWKKNLLSNIKLRTIQRDSTGSVQKPIECDYSVELTIMQEQLKAARTSEHVDCPKEEQPCELLEIEQIARHHRRRGTSTPLSKVLDAELREKHVQLTYWHKEHERFLEELRRKRHEYMRVSQRNPQYKRLISETADLMTLLKSFELFYFFYYDKNGKKPRKIMPKP
jgi:hypothetical protein